MNEGCVKGIPSMEVYNVSVNELLLNTLQASKKIDLLVLQNKNN